VWKGELEVLGEELFDVGATDVRGLLNLDNLENVDGPEPGTMTSSHILVQGSNRVGAGHLTVLFVHVVGAGARVVADPDTEVLDLGGPLLVDLVKRHDLSSTLLDLPELFQEVPETGLRYNGVGSEEAHPVELRSGLGLRGEFPADDLILMKTTLNHSVGKLAIVRRT